MNCLNCFSFYRIREIHKSDAEITITRRYSYEVKEASKKFSKVKSGKHTIRSEVKEVEVLVSNKTIEVDMKGSKSGPRIRKAGVRNQEVEQQAVRSRDLEVRNQE